MGLPAFLTTPIQSLRLRDAAAGAASSLVTRRDDSYSQSPLADLALAASGHTSHPDFAHLILLVFEAVLEVVCVSLPGYIVARRGMFDGEAQKMVANLNVQLFTPCLVFTKLASQLNAEKLADLAVIPFIFVIQTLVSWLCSLGVSKLSGFGKRQTNFVIAMGVFGNSNSLPISLVLSLSKTLKGLHWDQVPGDNDNEVAARGILYLLIFQQLGQLVRWTWGYNVLLAPPTAEDLKEEYGEDGLVEQGGYRDETDSEEGDTQAQDGVDSKAKANGNGNGNGRKITDANNSDYESGPQSPQSSSSSSSSDAGIVPEEARNSVMSTPANGNMLTRGPSNFADNLGPRYRSTGHITQFPTYGSNSSGSSEQQAGVKGAFYRFKSAVARFFHSIASTIKTFFVNNFRRLPPRLQKVLVAIGTRVGRFAKGAWSFMNPPLWAMVAALIVASVPSLQRLFFQEGSFVKNSVTRAISQSGNVAVPLILVVLGANLARNTLPQEELHLSPEAAKKDRKLLVAALVARMLLPTLVMAPILAVVAKFVPVSILDDPIFVIVCFLLTGAPSALQLAQICQLNNVYMGVMAKLLFQSYVVWILPSTLVLVMVALEVVEWAAASA